MRAMRAVTMHDPWADQRSFVRRSIARMAVKNIA
jgi:hypothetical protein